MSVVKPFIGLSTMFENFGQAVHDASKSLNPKFTDPSEKCWLQGFCVQSEISHTETLTPNDARARSPKMTRAKLEEIVVLFQ
jgi:hypothetical protein